MLLFQRERRNVVAGNRIEMREAKDKLIGLTARGQIAHCGDSRRLHRLRRIIDQQNCINVVEPRGDRRRQTRRGIGRVAETFAIDQHELWLPSRPLRRERPRDANAAHQRRQQTSKTPGVVAGKS